MIDDLWNFEDTPKGCLEGKYVSGPGLQSSQLRWLQISITSIKLLTFLKTPCSPASPEPEVSICKGLLLLQVSQLVAKDGFLLIPEKASRVIPEEAEINV